ncbi:MAG: toll/interleukin-1 receptor domain-containing protein [Planctomycetota bacterium]
MTATANTTYDVFISHAASDRELATEIAGSLESVGLETFHTGTVQAGSDLGEAIWQALAESRALIAIISPDIPTNAMGMVEIGAAAAWNKQIFLLINGPSSTKLPPALSSYPVFPLNRLDEVIQAIRTGFEPLTDSERTVLADIYSVHNTSADQLSHSPKALRELTGNFNKQTNRQFSGERLMWELLRMRKSGKLPRLRSRQ